MYSCTTEPGKPTHKVKLCKLNQPLTGIDQSFYFNAQQPRKYCSGPEKQATKGEPAGLLRANWLISSSVEL
jgi:hypothetical protein